jgi:putative FmdB family regulatory protein
MPIYEYECEKCDFRFELRRSFSDNGGGICPQCGCEAQRRFAQVPIIFKGSGFYVTDYRKDSSETKEKLAGESLAGAKESD